MQRQDRHADRRHDVARRARSIRSAARRSGRCSLAHLNSRLRDRHQEPARRRHPRACRSPDAEAFTKTDEIPFDFERRRCRSSSSSDGAFLLDHQGRTGGRPRARARPTSPTGRSDALDDAARARCLETFRAAERAGLSRARRGLSAGVEAARLHGGGRARADAGRLPDLRRSPARGRRRVDRTAPPRRRAGQDPDRRQRARDPPHLRRRSASTAAASSSASEIERMDEAALARVAEQAQRVRARLAGAEASHHSRAQGARARRRLPRRRHQRRAVAARRRRRHLGGRRRRRRARGVRHHPARAPPRRAARRHHRRPPVVRQRPQVPADGHQLELRQHVQHGRRRAVPAVPADAADADPAQQLPLRLRADHDSDRQRRPELRPAPAALGHRADSATSCS